jgi:ribose transport system substrate-binding protein
MQRPLSTLILTAAAIALALNQSAFAGEGTPENPWVVGMSQCNLGEPWRVQMNADVRRAGAEHDNIRVEFKDAQNDSLRQRTHVEEFVAQGVDVLIVSPKEAAPLTPPIRKAHQAGIPVIVLDRRVIGEDYTCFIGADNKLIGEMAGKWIKKQLKGRGLVVELKGLMTSTPGQDRHTGFRKGIEDAKIAIPFEADGQWLEPNGRKEMESALARLPKIDVVYAHNDPMAHGAYLAAKAAGREKDIQFVGIDALPHEGMMYVKQGVLAATFVYPTGGAEAIANALEILKGQKVEKEITLDTECITAANVDEKLKAFMR